MYERERVTQVLEDLGVLKCFRQLIDCDTTTIDWMCKLFHASFEVEDVDYTEVEHAVLTSLVGQHISAVLRTVYSHVAYLLLSNSKIN